MTSATDRLRALLDERGMEYRTDDAETVKATHWKFGENGSAMFTEYDDGECVFVTSGCSWTPEQAIEATLGRGECEIEPLSALYVTLNQLDQTEWGVCSNCGTASPIDATYCCECGRKVKR